MTPTTEQQQFMADNRPHYDTLIRADFLTNIGQDVKNGLLNVARVFAPAYQANLWCGPCVCDLVKFSYTQYDKWAEDELNKATIESPKDDIHFATFPKQDSPSEPHGIEPVKETEATPKKRGRKAKAK